MWLEVDWAGRCDAMGTAPKYESVSYASDEETTLWAD